MCRSLPVGLTVVRGSVVFARGLIAYFDHGHLTATFARTLASEVTGSVRDALAR